jgi:hypothetical protein
MHDVTARRSTVWNQGMNRFQLIRYQQTRNQMKIFFSGRAVVNISSIWDRMDDTVRDSEFES